MNFLTNILSSLLKTTKSFFSWFLKQDGKTIAIEVLAVAVIALFVMLRFKKSTTNTIYIGNTAQLDSLSTYKDKNGKLTESLQMLTIQNTQLKNAVDSISKVVNVKVKEVHSITNIVTKTVVKDSLIYVTVDKHGNRTFATSTPYVDLDVEIDSAEKGSFYLSTIDTITALETVKKPFLGIGTTTHTLTLRNTNPYNHITAGNSYVVQEKKIWLTIGPSIEYNPFTKKVDFGISIQYPLIKLTH